MNRADKNRCENEILILLVLSRGAESRKKILKALLHSSKNCSQIAREVGLDWWTVQKHLCRLMKKNIVNSSDFGNSKFYRLTPKGEEVIRALQSSNGKNFDFKSQDDSHQSESSSLLSSTMYDSK